MTTRVKRAVAVVSLCCFPVLHACIAGGCDAGRSTSTSERTKPPDDPISKSSGHSFEVWLVDQSNTTGLTFGGAIYIYDGDDLAHDPASAEATDLIDLAADTAALCMASTGANPVRPHMLLFNSTHRHAVLSFVTSGHVVVFDAETRVPISCLRTSAGAGGARQAHAAFPAPDDSYILVANQNGKLLERIDTDVDADGVTYEHSGDIALDPAATLDLATCTTPSGIACQLTGVRPDNAPICPIIDTSSGLGFITLRGGGLFVVDPKATPMTIVGEYDSATIHRNGCGGVEADESMFINSGGGTASNLSEFDVYRFPLSGYDPANPPNTPAPILVFSDDASEPARDSHGAAATKHDKYLWVADRARNLAEVFKVSNNARVNTVDLAGPWSDDPSPDLIDTSPSRKYLFFSLRGPNPLTGDPHVSTGSTPGIGVVKLTQGGRNGRLRGIARISNIDASGVERADPHGIRVRKVPQCDGDDEGDDDDDDDCHPPVRSPLVLPDDWAGTWQISITARNCQTDEVVAIDEYEDLICPGEMIGEGLLRLFEQCDTDHDGDSFHAHCTRSFTSQGCEIRQRLDIELNRQSDSLSGQGYWFVVFEGACDGLGAAPCERVVVEGTRVSGDVAACVP